MSRFQVGVQMSPFWRQDADRRHSLVVYPFGTLLVVPGEQGDEDTEEWYVVWRQGTSRTIPATSVVVAGAFSSAETALDEAKRWLFDSWQTIETQIEPQPASEISRTSYRELFRAIGTLYRRDRTANAAALVFIALLVGVLAGIALAELL